MLLNDNEKIVPIMAVNPTFVISSASLPLFKYYLRCNCKKAEQVDLNYFSCMAYRKGLKQQFPIETSKRNSIANTIMRNFCSVTGIKAQMPFVSLYIAYELDCLGNDETVDVFGEQEFDFLKEKIDTVLEGTEFDLFFMATHIGQLGKGKDNSYHIPHCHVNLLPNLDKLQDLETYIVAVDNLLNKFKTEWSKCEISIRND